MSLLDRPLTPSRFIGLRLTNWLYISKFKLKFKTKIVGLYPEGSPSRNSRGHKANPGPGGGLEIVFNQQ
ncbi:LOW QUALITY PROTEIN: uncharacterized protein LOC126787457 [Argentina anserina]|uniref:LOW QUALITY PROTEIN: uncharacterized protein LOC126787457 n=1 Tax=Argentina anserina TaxID=57926 RepID=UPI0021766BD4|nr:LOW QUALITY PROTEIN: uncharacterized protein LOC126787457 [Potentilla anserina]